MTKEDKAIIQNLATQIENTNEINKEIKKNMRLIRYRVESIGVLLMAASIILLLAEFR